MEFSIDRESLANAVNVIKDSIASRDYIPILKDVYVEVREDELILRSSDSELWSQVILEADIEKEGAVCVPGTKFCGWILMAAGEKVQVKTGKGLMKIKSGKQTATLYTAKANLFPEFPSDFIEIADLDSKFTKRLKRVAVTMTDNASWTEMRGVEVSNNKRGLRFASTNRIAVNEYRCKGRISETVVIQDSLVLRLIAVDPPEFTLYHSDNYTGVVAEEDGMYVELAHRKFESEFVNVDSILKIYKKKTPKFVAIVSRGDLLLGCLTSEFGADQNDPIVELTFSNGKLVMAGKEDKLGSGRLDLRYKTERDRLVKAQVITKPIARFLEVARGDKVTIGFFGSSDPIKFYAHKNHVLWYMPISVKIE